MIAAVVQARTGSTRLPGKTMMDIGGRPMLAHVIERAHLIEGVEAVIVATTNRPADRIILEFARARGLSAFAGSEEDVLDRVYRAARRYGVTAIVRVTPDCPLLDPGVSCRVLKRFLASAGRLDYVSNTHPPTYPDGLDTEVFSVSALERAWRESRLASEREHVTPYLWKHPETFRLANVVHHQDLSALRWTVDEPRDLEFAREIHRRLGPSPFGMQEVLRLLRDEPDLAAINPGLGRNAGYLKSLRSDRAVTEAPGG